MIKTNDKLKQKVKRCVWDLMFFYSVFPSVAPESHPQASSPRGPHHPSLTPPEDTLLRPASPLSPSCSHLPPPKAPTTVLQHRDPQHAEPSPLRPPAKYVSAGQLSITLGVRVEEDLRNNILIYIY